MSIAIWGFVKLVSSLITAATSVTARARRSGVALLAIGVLAGVCVGGGIGVLAASPSKSVTVCANKKTNVLRYAKNGKCVSKKETKVVLSQVGVNGTNGSNGVAGANGTNGTNGTDGSDGVNGSNGVAGANGTNGTNGTDGSDGVNGVAGTNGSDGVNGTSGSTFVPQYVCGPYEQQICELRSVGPGGGLIFFIDTEGLYEGLDYLEAAPADSGHNVPWVTTIARCGLNQDVNCQEDYLSPRGESRKYWAVGTGRAATAAIVARHDIAPSVLKSQYAAGLADNASTPRASDWWLPSNDEASLMFLELFDGDNVGGFVANGQYCVSSEEFSGPPNDLVILWSPLDGGAGFGTKKSDQLCSVRAVRGF